jgi:hypothetical protein
MALATARRVSRDRPLLFVGGGHGDRVTRRPDAADPGVAEPALLGEAVDVGV